MAATNTVIIGSGIIGLSTAYYLSESPRSQAQSIHLVDSAPELFRCASGMAAGFLAANWFSPAVTPLGELSFRLHRELAENYGGRKNWGYSPSISTSLSVSSSTKLRQSNRETDWLADGSSRANAAAETQLYVDGDTPTWLTRYEGDELEVLSRGEKTAQIDPKKLCEFLLEKVKERGVLVHQPAKVVSVSTDARDEVAAVRIEEEGAETDLPCTRLVITSGPWTPQVFSSLFPESSLKVPITSLAGHSLVLRTPRWLNTVPDSEFATQAVFTSSSSEGFAPEIFSRVSGEIYIAGLNSPTIPLPGDASGAKTQDYSMERLKRVAKQMLGLPGGEDDLQIVREGLCFRPVTNTGMPIVSRISDDKLGGPKTRGGGEGGVFIAAGHGPWGIALSLGTGKVLSELIEDIEPSADVSPLKS